MRKVTKNKMSLDRCSEQEINIISGGGRGVDEGYYTINPFNPAPKIPIKSIAKEYTSEHLR